MSRIAERRQEEKERRHSDIIDAAEAVAATVGLDAMTMDEVARKARLSRALLYVYFKDKPDLLFAICQRALENLRVRFEAVAHSHATGLAAIRAMGTSFVEYSREQPVRYDALARFARHAPQQADGAANERACLETGDSVHRIMDACIERGIADGSIRADVGPPGLVALSLWSYTLGIIQLATTKAAVIEHRGYDVEHLIEHALQMAARALAPR
ncbi:MAG TPA: TetR/AcrR family transcriptional regulator [Steroidobacteraceae bacterium]|jgi:AcrR family transcriptional regulator|nr:TetR/AcrR family transcriptional regulator [Steroidobacteraceae bacterium]HNS26770.1 TetR/AcrR family transcriptional regulator [Steroidobacteraceae bacterium]